jgi:hypothetical protein
MARRLTTNQEIAGSIPAVVTCISTAYGGLGDGFFVGSDVLTFGVALLL